MGLLNLSRSGYDGSRDFEIFRGGKNKKKTRTKYTNPNITRKEYADKLAKQGRGLASNKFSDDSGTRTASKDAHDASNIDISGDHFDLNDQTGGPSGEQAGSDTHPDRVDATTGRVPSVDPEGRITELGEDLSKVESSIIAGADKYAQSLRRDSALKLLESALAATEAVNDIIQIREEYAQMAEQSDLNKTLIDEEIDRMITSGQGQAMLEQAAGRTKAETEQLKLAAQGQRLSGAGAGRVERSHQLTAVANAVDARTAMISRAMGYEYEKISIDRNLAYANISKQFKTFGGLVRTGFHLSEGAVSSGLLGGASGP